MRPGRSGIDVAARAWEPSTLATYTSAVNAFQRFMRVLVLLPEPPAILSTLVIPASCVFSTATLRALISDSEVLSELIDWAGGQGLAHATLISIIRGVRSMSISAAFPHVLPPLTALTERQLAGYDKAHPRA